MQKAKTGSCLAEMRCFMRKKLLVVVMAAALCGVSATSLNASARTVPSQTGIPVYAGIWDGSDGFYYWYSGGTDASGKDNSKNNDKKDNNVVSTSSSQTDVKKQDNDNDQTYVPWWTDWEEDDDWDNSGYWWNNWDDDSSSDFYDVGNDYDGDDGYEDDDYWGYWDDDELSVYDIAVNPVKKVIKKGKSFSIDIVPSDDYEDEYITEEEWEELCEDNIADIEFFSAKKSVASVNKFTGKVKAKKSGTAIIKTKVTLDNGESAIYKTKVTVKK